MYETSPFNTQLLNFHLAFQLQECAQPIKNVRKREEPVRPAVKEIRLCPTCVVGRIAPAASRLVSRVATPQPLSHLCGKLLLLRAVTSPPTDHTRRWNAFELPPRACALFWEQEIDLF